MLIALLIILWILKMSSGVIRRKPKIDTAADQSVRFLFALLWPLLAMAKVYIWNTWVCHWIGWPQITTLEQYAVTMFFL